MCQNFETELCRGSWLQLKVLQVTKLMFTLKRRRIYDMMIHEEAQAALDRFRTQDLCKCFQQLILLVD
jgi:hypothetical protein